MKKLFIILSIILIFGFNIAFAQQIEYSGFIKSVVDPDGIAILNDNIYKPGEVVEGTPYMLISIEYNYVVLKHTTTGDTIKVRFKLSGPPGPPPISS